MAAILTRLGLVCQRQNCLVCRLRDRERVRRLRRHQHERFTSLWEPDVPFEENVAERMIPQVVIMRTNVTPPRVPGPAKADGFSYGIPAE